MKRFAIVIAVLSGLALVQILFKPISMRSELATVGNAMAEIAALRDVLRIYREKAGAFPQTLADARSTALEAGRPDALKYSDPTTRETTEWLYFPSGLKTTAGNAIAATPVVFNRKNSEMKKYGDVDQRVVLMETGEIAIVPASEVVKAPR